MAAPSAFSAARGSWAVRGACVAGPGERGRGALGYCQLGRWQTGPHPGRRAKPCLRWVAEKIGKAVHRV
jgi:hypothetical protein